MEYQFIKDLTTTSKEKLFFYSSKDIFDYEKEMSGETHFCKALCEFSIKSDSLLFTRVTSNLFGVKNDSLIVYDRGVLFGVFDEINCFNSKEINVLDTHLGRFCVLIETDIMIDNIVQIVTTFDPDYVVISVKKYLVQDALALEFGAPVFVISEKMF